MTGFATNTIHLLDGRVVDEHAIDESAGLLEGQPLSP
jgi:hypothetical protein